MSDRTVADLRGEGDPDIRLAHYIVTVDRLTAERDAAVEQRTLAEQKMVDACDELTRARKRSHYDTHSRQSSLWYSVVDVNRAIRKLRAALADPEADR